MFNLDSLNRSEGLIGFSINEDVFDGINGFSRFHRFQMVMDDGRIFTLIMCNTSREYDFYDLESNSYALGEFVDLASSQGFTYLEDGFVMVSQFVRNNPMEFDEAQFESMDEANVYLNELRPIHR